MAQLTADQLGACTVPAHLLWIYLFDWMTMATVAGGYCRKGGRVFDLSSRHLSHQLAFL